MYAMIYERLFVYLVTGAVYRRFNCQCMKFIRMIKMRIKQKLTEGKMQ